MKLITSTNGNCVAASLAMLFDMSLEDVLKELPVKRGVFPPPWDTYAKVASTDEIVEWAFNKGYCMVPFNNSPMCRPHDDCPPCPVWGFPEEMFEMQLYRGPGLLEGQGTKVMHMTAWNGDRVYDPSGHTYNIRDCRHFGFQPLRFWLKVKRGE